MARVSSENKHPWLSVCGFVLSYALSYAVIIPEILLIRCFAFMIGRRAHKRLAVKPALPGSGTALDTSARDCRVSASMGAKVLMEIYPG